MSCANTSEQAYNLETLVPPGKETGPIDQPGNADTGLRGTLTLGIQARGNLSVGKPELGNPGWGTRAGEPGLGNPDSGEPGLGGTRTRGTRTGEPGLGNPDSGEPGLGEPGLGEPGLGEPGLGEPGLWGTRTGGTRTPPRA